MAPVYTTFTVLPNGNLEIALTAEGKEMIAETQDWLSRHPDVTYRVSLEELIEWYTCNGWEWVQPYEISALTDSPILSEDVQRDILGNVTGCGKVYWFPAYEVRSPEDVLVRTGRVVFEGVE